MTGISKNIEDAARLAMGGDDHHDPLPPGPNYGPFGYFRLGLLVFAGVVVVLFALSFF